ncbi:hypothetical protein BC830DRAFT_321061 [Chytriomyces sp. MP71]|nr:hypothetical protein BC830DRAFT_321061 [Chytriomyces sp. MP71]
MEHIDAYIRHFDFLLSRNRVLSWIEAKLRIPKTQIATVLLLITAASLAFHIGHLTVSNALTTFLPARAFLNSCLENNTRGILLYGFYFLVLRCVNVVQDALYEPIMAFLPLWFLCKVGWCWWAWLPGSMGIEVLYQFTQKYVPKILKMFKDEIQSLSE